MEELKRKAFNKMDLMFRTLLEYEAEHNYKMVTHIACDINSKIDLLLSMELITFDEWNFINKATLFVQCAMEVA